MDNDGPMDSIGLALQGKDQHFLSHPTCLALLQEEWYGGVNVETQEPSIFLTVLFPPLLLYLGSWMFRIKLTPPVVTATASSSSEIAELNRNSRMRFSMGRAPAAAAAVPYYAHGRDIIQQARGGHVLTALATYGRTIVRRASAFYRAPITKVCASF